MKGKKTTRLWTVLGLMLVLSLALAWTASANNYPYVVVYARPTSSSFTLYYARYASSDCLEGLESFGDISIDDLGLPIYFDEQASLKLVAPELNTDSEGFLFWTSPDEVGDLVEHIPDENSPRAICLNAESVSPGTAYYAHYTGCTAPTSVSIAPPSPSRVVGQSMTFEATVAPADATEEALSYQWYKDGSALAGDYSSYAINPVSESDEGLYWVVVTSGCDLSTVESNHEFLTVVCTPISSVSIDLTDAVVDVGESVTFQATVDPVVVATPLTYQWYKVAIPADIPVGGNSSEYGIPSVAAEDQGEYYVTVSNPCSSETFESNHASLTVNECTAPESVSLDPILPVEAGDSVTFSIANVEPDDVTTPLSYQWYKVATPNDITVGGNSSDYEILSAVEGDAGEYYVIVSNACGSAESDHRTLTVGEEDGECDLVANPGDGYQAFLPNATIQFDGTGSEGTISTYAWDFGDGSGVEIGSDAQPSHTYEEPGVYYVCLTVSGDGCVSEQACTTAVVVDPSAGFVMGWGSINSPTGAYRPDENLSGRASFAFLSRYMRGAYKPAGYTQFDFYWGGLHFFSMSQDWLVVNKGGTRAQFKGSGWVNGQPGYQFMLWATDTNPRSGWRLWSSTPPDTFRIRIWSEDGEGLVYDNNEEQEIAGGSIIVSTW